MLTRSQPDRSDSIDSLYGTDFLSRLKLTAGEKLDDISPLHTSTPDTVPFTTGRQGGDVIPVLDAHDPDVVNLHWVLGGFFDIETIGNIDRPLVWTLHDMWPFTGGCYYSADCERYTDQCGACPVIDSDVDDDRSRFVWKRKATAWNELDLTVVTPSSWLANRARESSLFGERPIRVIPNGLDLAAYDPKNRTAARDRYGLPKDASLVLFGAHDHYNDRKGAGLLVHALEQFRATDVPNDVELVTFGTTRCQISNAGFDVYELGYVDDVGLRTLYSACDVTVVPSRQENLPNIISESFAAGTPCVAFDVGGIPEMIDHRENGYLATAEDPSSLARGIEWVLADKERWNDLSAVAKETAESRYSLKRMAREYRDLYETIM